MLRLIVGSLVMGLLLAGPIQAQSPREPVLVDGKSSLPLRVLTRPMSNLHQLADENSPIIEGNLPAFSNFFVYTRPGGEKAATGQGWYEVGSDDQGRVLGWLKADDVFEWRQTMCLAYTNPSGRQPVLMFEGRRDLENLIKEAPEQRKLKAESLYQTIASGQIAADFPVISVEPKLAVDLAKQFYLLPILDFQAIELDGREGRLLELAAVTAAGPESRAKSDIRTNADYLAAASVTPEQATRASGENLTVDLIWVIDTTVSMAPYIESTLGVVSEVSEILALKPELSSRIKFGVWGYRDPVEAIADIEYTTRNYTPELQDIDGFVASMAQVKETKIDSVDFPEDVFSGLSDALYETAWRPGSLRLMVLVGDAPGHELGHPWNLSSLDAEKFRSLANEKKTTVLALQVRPNGARKYQRLAEDQFRTIALNAGAELYYDVKASELAGFAKATEMVVEAVINLVAQAVAASAEPGDPTVSTLTSTGVAGSADPVVSTAVSAGGSASADQTSTSLPLSGEQAALLEDEQPAVAPDGGKDVEFRASVDKALRAALVDWLGSSAEAQAPRDITAWVVDKDLIDASLASLEVRLLINKRQLDALSTLLNDVIRAGRTSGLSGDDFFTSLQAASAVAARDPEKLSQAATLGQSGLVPEFLEGLPYNSRLMSMNNDLWNSLSPDEQDGFVNTLEANIKAYKSIHDDPGGWVALNEGDDADATVYPIPLDLLP